jgi:toxin ParE1/3/4
MKESWSPQAIRQVQEIWDCIAADSATAADHCLEAIFAKLDLVLTHPYQGRHGRVAGTREAVLPGSPYLINYHVRHEILEIAAVQHGRQHWPPAPTSPS